MIFLRHSLTKPSPTRHMDECESFYISFQNFVLTQSPSNSNYVDQDTAVAKNLTIARGDTLILRADDTTVLDPNGPGRDSVRIRSKKTYTTHVVV